MELKTYNIGESAVLDCIETIRFKKSRFTVTLTLPADSETYACAVMLMPLSMRATESYRDFSALCRRCDELYAADVSDMLSLRGGYISIGLRASMLGNRYVAEAEQKAGFDLAKGVFALLSEILFHPLFEESDLENEKTILINRIKSQINDPLSFALRRLRESMMGGEPGVLTSEQAINDIEELTTEKLRAFREKLISNAAVEFFYSGEEKSERIIDLASEYFSPLMKKREVELANRAVAKREAQCIDEEGDYAQSNLLLGFRSNILQSDADFYAAELANEILGEGPISKLFINLREKQSLCYFCGSDYDEINGTLTVGCSIAARDREKAEREIFRQLEDIRRGKISDAELKAAKQSIFSDCREAEDHPEDYEDFSRMSRRFGGPSNIAEYRENIAAVTREQIAEAAKKFSLDTLYFLRGRLEETEDAK